MKSLISPFTGLPDFLGNNSGSQLITFPGVPPQNDVDYSIGTISYNADTGEFFILKSNSAGENSWVNLTTNLLDFNDSAISFAKSDLAPPTSNYADRYILGNELPVHPDWDGALNKDIVTFNGVEWVAKTPTSGSLIYSDEDERIYVFDFSWKSASSSVPPASYDVLGLSSYTINDFNVVAGAVSLKTVNVEHGGTGSNSLTQNGLLIGNGINPVTSTTSGIAGQILQAGGSSAPAWTVTTYPSAVSQGSILTASIDNTITPLLKDVNASRYLSNSGTDNNPAWSTIDLVNGVSEILAEANGGTGESSYTDGEILIGNSLNGLTKATLTAGEGVEISNGDGSITIDCEDATSTNKGIASFYEDDFNVNSGNVELVYPSEVTGFINSNDVTVTFDNITRTVTLEPKLPATQFEFRSMRKNFIKTSADSFQISATEGIHYVYYNEGILEETMIFSDSIISEFAFVAALYWDNTNNKQIYFGDEFKHGTNMGNDTHIYAHLTIGFKISTGGGLGDITADGDGNLDASAQFSNEATLVFDEDAAFNHLARASTDNIIFMYKEGTEAVPIWRATEVASFGVQTTGTGRAAFNELSAGNWIQTEVANNDFLLAHVFTFNDSTRRFGVIQGENQYATRNAAREGALTEVASVTTAGLPGPEFKFVGSIIYQTSDSYGNAVKSRIISTGEGGDYVDLRDITFSRDGVAGTITNHGDLTGLLVDDHTQYVLADGTRAMDELTVSNQITLLPVTAPAHSSGDLFFDTDTDALTFYNSDSNVSLQVGEESRIKVKNNTGVTITNGSVVYISGYDGIYPEISDAIATSVTTSMVIGVCTQNIQNGSTGYITTFGLVRDLNTQAIPSGTPIYLSESTAGGIQIVKPSGSNYCVCIGYVGVQSTTVGTFLVTIANGGAKSDIVGLRDADDVTFNSISGSVNVGAGDTLSVEGAIDLSSPLSVTNGGTGYSSYIDGQLLIGNGSTNGLDRTRLTQGTGIRITNSTGKITIEATNDDSEASVINIVDNTAVPPTEVLGDRYILDDTAGGVNASWDGASANDIVQFDGTSWVSTTPSDGCRSFNETDNYIYIFTGSSWGYLTQAIPDATDTQRGIASFDADDFVVSGGNVSLAEGGTARELKLNSVLINNLTFTGVKMSYTANENQVFGDVCFVNSSGKAQIGSASDEAKAPVSLMCVETATAGTDAVYVAVGATVRNDSFSFTAGDTIYLSTVGTSGNTITSAQPSAEDEIIQFLGTALSSNTILFESDLTTLVVGSANDLLSADVVQYDNATSGLTATDVQTAIDEIAGVSLIADDVNYTNTTSSLAATNVQDAIDEITAQDLIAVDVSYDNTSSGLVTPNVQGAIDQLVNDAVDTAFELSYNNTTSGLAANNVQAAIDELEAEVTPASEVTFSNATSWLTSTDVQGAIDELSGGTGSASDISYSNASSGLSATNVQDAIDELEAEVVPATDITFSGAVSGLSALNVQTAINEVVSDAIKTAVDMPYVNTTSGLSATNVKSAIDEVVADAVTTSSELPYINSASGLAAVNVQTAIDEVVSDMDDLGLINILTYTTSGVYNKLTNRPKYVVVTVVGGGGGGGRRSTGDAAAGGGGGGGASIERIPYDSLLTSTTVTVGNGGIGATSDTSGTTGSTSSFGSHCSGTGGIGGGRGSALYDYVTGGIGTGGNINIKGGPGYQAACCGGSGVDDNSGGDGGGTIFGGGASGSIESGLGGGQDGQAYGSGGGGSRGYTGGDGAKGVVIVKEYK